MSFDRIAEFYPLLFDKSARLAREGPLLLELLNRYQQPVRVLDLACGTGIHSQFFSEQGADVIGLDISPEMLMYAKEQPYAHNVFYLVADLTHLPLAGRWNIILCLGNSLCLLRDYNCILDFFSQVKKLLAPQGTFILQILNYNHSDMKEVQTKCIRKEQEDKKVTVIKTFIPDNDVVFLSINYFAKVQGEYKTSSDTNILQKLSLQDLSTIVQKAGLSIVSIFGDFQKSNFNIDTSRDVIVILSIK